MKGVDRFADEDPAAMQNATLSPIPLLRRSLEVVGPIYWLLLTLAFPSFVLPIVAGLFFSGQLLGLGLACWAIGAPILVGAAFGLVDQHLKQQPTLLDESLKQAVSRAGPLIIVCFLILLAGGWPTFALCAIVLENQGLIQGLRYSWNLVESSFGKVLWAFWAPVLVLVLFLFFVILLTGVLSGNSLDSGVLLYVTLGISYAVVIAAFPIYNIYILLLFRSLQQLKGQAAS